MKQAEHPSPKPNFDIRKRPINGKLFQNQKPKQQFILNTKKTMGKKYMQQANIFKQKQDQPKKQHRQIVMSEQFIRSSKLYRLLKEKMDRSDSIFIKEVNALNEHKLKLKEQMMQIRSQNYQEKVSLWELKNKLMELKIMYHEEQEQSKRLVQQNFGQYEGEEEYEGEGDNMQENTEQHEGPQGPQPDGQEQNRQGLEDQQMQYINHMEDNLPVIEPTQNTGQQSRSQFTQILQQLMSLKAEREARGVQQLQYKLEQQGLDLQNMQQDMGSNSEQIQDYPQPLPQL